LEGDEIKIFEEISITLAISTPEETVAPVILNTNKKTVEEIPNAIHHLSITRVT